MYHPDVKNDRENTAVPGALTWTPLNLACSSSASRGMYSNVRCWSILVPENPPSQKKKTESGRDCCKRDDTKQSLSVACCARRSMGDSYSMYCCRDGGDATIHCQVVGGNQ